MTITVQHAGREAEAGRERELIACSHPVTSAMSSVFNDVAQGIKGIEMTVRSEHSNMIIKLIILSGNRDQIAEKFVTEVNKRFAALDDEQLEQMLDDSAIREVFATHSATASFNNADQSGV